MFLSTVLLVEGDSPWATCWKLTFLFTACCCSWLTCTKLRGRVNDTITESSSSYSHKMSQFLASRVQQQSKWLHVQVQKLLIPTQKHTNQPAALRHRKSGFALLALVWFDAVSQVLDHQRLVSVFHISGSHIRFTHRSCQLLSSTSWYLLHSMWSRPRFYSSSLQTHYPI